MQGNPIFMQNIERMPVTLSPVSLDHLFDTPQQIGRRITLSYKQQMLRQVGDALACDLCRALRLQLP